MVSGSRVFAAAAAACAAAWLWSWYRLPERVPVHFDGGGSPDAWSSRAGALWTAALLGLGTALVFAGTVWLTRRISVGLINTPHPRYWKRPENVPRLRELMVEDLWLIGAWTMLLLAAVQLLIVREAGQAEPRLDGWAVAVVVGYVVVVLGQIVWMYTRRYAVPDEE